MKLIEYLRYKYKYNSYNRWEVNISFYILDLIS